MIRRVSWAAMLGLLAFTSADAGEDRMVVYIGTYTGGGSKGIHVFHLNPSSGALDPAGVGEGVTNPSFLALHPGGRFLYAACETGNYGGKKTGSVAAFAVDPKTGALTLLNQQPSEGTSPCHLVVDREGKHVLVANYSSGTVAALPVGGDGRLGPATSVAKHEGSSVNPRRQKEPHAHSINLDAAGRFAFAADLGIDKVMVYRFDPGKGTLAAHDPAFAAMAPGSGPRHFAFHPGGRYAYVINELLSTVTAFGYDAERGTLKEIQTVTTLPQDFQGNNSTAEIRVSPDGRFLYGSNRGHDSLAIFSIDPETGRLTPSGHQPTGGKTPRNFGIDPSGTWLLAANQNSDTVVAFRIDRATGKPQPTGTVLQVSKPVCVKFLRLP